MREIHRPIHSGYDMLRHHRDLSRREAQFNSKPFPVNEQMTALGYAVGRRSTGFLEQGFSR